MTSANVIEYNIYDKEGKKVGRHSQNVMCLRCNDGLNKFTPASDFEIESWGYDEEENEWEGCRSNLETWLNLNPAEFTHKVFSKGDKLRVKRKGEGIVLDSRKGNWEYSYTIGLENGDLLENVSQNQVLPITT